ncbi:MAG: hypothetical protein DHS20C15_15720 [Planctomycetota bacterium]|nr:MAG: hypothetical protein DHS20C15_15720 [Planctomycetota bacterium]
MAGQGVAGRLGGRGKREAEQRGQAEAQVIQHGEVSQIRNSIGGALSGVLRSLGQPARGTGLLALGICGERLDELARGAQARVTSARSVGLCAEIHMKEISNAEPAIRS